MLLDGFLLLATFQPGREVLDLKWGADVAASPGGKNGGLPRETAE